MKSKKYRSLKRNLFSTETFIVKAKAIHGNKYDYSKTVFTGQTNKITVTCRKHGDFFPRASHHVYSKQGCRQCFFESKQTSLEEIIKKAKLKHNDKYSYEKTNYVKSHNKVTVTCPVHGDFIISITNHLQGQGCRQCGIIKIKEAKTSSKSDFILKAKSIHGALYDYTDINYTLRKNKIKLKCKIHGNFSITPERHLRGAGCQKCALEKIHNNRRFTLEEFVQKAKAIHGDKYDYKNAVYSNCDTKIQVLCNKHKTYFYIKPMKHLNGQGCKQCGIKRATDLSKSSLENFILKAKSIHGALYDYSFSEYINNHTKLKIICTKHGEFNIRPMQHLKGGGCPNCKASKGELALRLIFEKNKINYTQQYRIPNILERLRYDFYLPDFNLLIEFHGIQHFKYIPFFHRNGEDDFILQKNRDKLAVYFSKLHKYHYLEFNYRQYKHLSIINFENLVIRKIHKLTKI